MTLMHLKKMLISAVLGTTLLTGCASVPMEDASKDAELKTFPAPPTGHSGLYIYRNTLLGAAIKKTLTLDGQYIGESASKTYFYQVVSPGQHVLATESEFGDNAITLIAEPDKNHFVNQYIKIGVFVGGANLEEVSEAEGRKGVLESKLAK